MTRLQEEYESTIRPALMKEFGYKNPLEVPRLEKIVLNMGVGEASQDRKKIDSAVAEMTLIAGQKPIITKAKKSIAAFKLRDGMTVGCKVTLRRERMYEFLDRLVTIALPRVRDFRGIPQRNFDGSGNFALGLKEQIVFPEIDYDRVEQIRGMNVVICTTAKTDNEARALLKAFNMPFSGRDPEQEKAEEAARRAALEEEKQAARDALREAEGDDQKEGDATATDGTPGDAAAPVTPAKQASDSAAVADDGKGEKPDG